MKYYVNGRAVRESTGTDDARKGQHFLEQRVARVKVGQPILPRAELVRYTEAAADLRTY